MNDRHLSACEEIFFVLLRIVVWKFYYVFQSDKDKHILYDIVPAMSEASLIVDFVGALRGKTLQRIKYVRCTSETERALWLATCNSFFCLLVITSCRIHDRSISVCLLASNFA